MSKFRNLIERIAYALPFGLKGGNDLLTSKTALGNDEEIHEEISDERVAKHLLKGEITKSVEELRYRTLKVDNKSAEYKYIGNGVAVKDGRTINCDRKIIKFTQDNKEKYGGVLDGMKGGLDRYDNIEWTTKIKYNNPSIRHKLQRCLKMIKVDINRNANPMKINTIMHFETSPNVYDERTKPLINCLAKINTDLMNDMSEEHYKSYVERQEVLTSMTEMSFTTYKASNGYPDKIEFIFSKPKFMEICEKNGEYLITWSWEKVEITNLLDKYYSKSMDEKYKNKEKKEVIINPFGEEYSERKAYCSVCGKEMSVYDADIQLANGDRPICTDCQLKLMKKENKKNERN